MPHDQSQGRAESDNALDAAAREYCDEYSHTVVMVRSAFKTGVQWQRDNANPALASAGMREVVEAMRQFAAANDGFHRAERELNFARAAIFSALANLDRDGKS